jgi:hypothetical protein
MTLTFTLVPFEHVDGKLGYFMDVTGLGQPFRVESHFASSVQAEHRAREIAANVGSTCFAINTQKLRKA